IWIKGPNVFSAYWRMPEASAASFKDEWFCTGDMGYLDPDGFLYITDRKMDMYISGGENVYPAEVERILSNYPLVAEVAVIGVADDKWGEVGVAVIHPKDADGSFSEDAFFAFCKDNLAGYKRPRKIIISKEPLPKTPTGKLVKKDLRQLLDR
ncbi:MAG: AMP-binding protein, partial [Desulfatitalea sp.]|nr:AMP-binding protein [Desulfatitalea sp.]NNK01437.1 AMP-binding protein [Desulfatitalea sp.]